MNKSDIIKAAELVDEWLSDTSGLTPTLQAHFAQALVEAADLLKQVKVVEVGELPNVGDVVFCDFMQKAYVVNNASIHSHQISQTVASDNLMRIIQRNGKPVITKGN